MNERNPRCPSPHEGMCDVSLDAASGVVEFNNGRDTFRICRRCLLETLRKLGVLPERSGK